MLSSYLKAALLTAGAAIAAWSLPATARTPLSLSDRLSLTLRERGAGENPLCKSASPAADGKVGIIATVSSPAAIAEMEARGLEITYAGDRSVAGIVPLSLLDSVISAEGVSRVSLSRRRTALNNLARRFTGVDPVREGDGLPGRFTGRNVVAGIFDIGIEPNHINFLDADGASRVQRLWHYEYLPETDTIVVHSCLTPEEIAAFTTDTPEKTHGTHVLGTLAGSFVSSGDDLDLRGMAPDVIPVVGCGELYDESILSGLAEVTAYAASEGLPCVINLSIGDKRGPHDATEPFVAALDEIAAQPGVTVCISAGNWGCEKVAVVKPLAASDSGIRTFLDHLSRRDTPSRPGFLSDGNVEVWSDGPEPFDLWVDIIDLRSPSAPLFSMELTEGQTRALSVSASLAPEADSIAVCDIFDRNFARGSFVTGAKEFYAPSGRYGAALSAKLDLLVPPADSPYRIALRVSGKPGRKIFVYATDYLDGDLCFESLDIAGYDAPTVDGTISCLCAGYNTISVGATVSRHGWAGSTGKLAHFSSYGQLADGRHKPDISAPGTIIWSSESRYNRLSEFWNEAANPDVYTWTDSDGRTHYWTTLEGTSMSSPVVAGTIALWLEANPSLTTDDIKRIIAATATPPNTVNREPEWYGAGTLDAYAGIKKALEMASGDLLPSSEEQRLTFTPLSSGGIELLAPAGISAVEIYSPAGLLLRRIDAAGAFSVTLPPDRLPSGIQIVRATTLAGHSGSWRFASSRP